MDISLIVKEEKEEARQIVLQGFEERFGIIIEGLNPDLDNIMHYYNGDNYFYIGKLHGVMVATGGIIFEGPGKFRVVRMSVLSQYRNLGLGRKMLSFLESEAKAKSASSIVLETNKDWKDAIGFYEKNGYRPYLEENERIHFRKELKS